MTQLVELDTVGAFGVIRDDKPYRLDPVAWSDVLNVRAVDGAMQSIGGREDVFGAPLADPAFVMPLITNSATFWLYMSLTGGFVWNGSVHTDISRASPYAATSYEQWNGIVFGGIPIFNNGVDIPQFWSTPNVATLLANLTNWDSNHRAKVIRSIGPYLVALNVTKSGTNYPHLVMWSHPADPGSVPSSWDVADPTKDTGQSDLPDVLAGVILNALNLRGQLFIYKEASTWRMRYVGGRSIFAFDTFSDTAGALSARSVSLTSDGLKHFLVTGDDVLLHDGNSATPIFDKRFRRYLFNQIDPLAYTKSFCFSLPRYKEQWFCYPSAGSTNPDMAVIWNEETGTITEVAIDFVHAAQGPIATSSGETWASTTDMWDTTTAPWSVVQRREVVVANFAAGTLQQMEVGNQFNGVPIETRLQRTGLALVGQKRDKTPIVDFDRRKLCTRVFPRLTGGPVQIRFGTQETPEGAVTWQGTQDFDPNLQRWLDVVIEGAALAIEVSSAADVNWKLEGYKLELDVDGVF